MSRREQTLQAAEPTDDAAGSHRAGPAPRHSRSMSAAGQYSYGTKQSSEAAPRGVLYADSLALSVLDLC